MAHNLGNTLVRRPFRFILGSSRLMSQQAGDAVESRGRLVRVVLVSPWMTPPSPPLFIKATCEAVFIIVFENGAKINRVGKAGKN